MINVEKRYRNKYYGESIVTERIYHDRLWHDTTEFVTNSVINSQISNRAIVLGNGISRLDFNLNLIKNHRGGLLGSRTLQSYGCNALYREFSPDFLVAIGDDIVKEISTTSYPNENIVYTNAIHLSEYPRKFYLIPHNPYTDAGTTAVYLAAFDGHKKVFMLGFDGQDTPNYNNNVYAGTNAYQPLHSNVYEYKWIFDRKLIFDVYDDTEFIRVTKKGLEPIPESWKYCPNFRAINYNQFVIEADL